MSDQEPNPTDPTDDASARYAMLELDVDPAWLTAALAALDAAQDSNALAAAIEPCRAQPEGPYKARVRTRLNARKIALGIASTPPAPTERQPIPVVTVPPVAAPVAPAVVAAVAALVLTIRVWVTGHRVLCTPVGHLGRDDFRRYVDACRVAGGSYSRRDNAQACNALQGPALARALESAGFVLQIDAEAQQAIASSLPRTVNVQPAPAHDSVVETHASASGLAPVTVEAAIERVDNGAPSATTAPLVPTAPASDVRTSNISYEPVPYTAPATTRGAIRNAGSSVSTNPKNDSVAPSLSAGDLIAGAAAHGNGVLLGWNGSGERSHALILEALQTAGFPLEWAPSVHSAHAQLGRAVSALQGTGYVVRAERGAAGQRVRTYRARWTVGQVNHGAQVGDGFGQTILTVTLGTDDKPKFEGNTGLGQRVLADFEKAIASELHSAADITQWLRLTLMRQFRACRLGGNWYVPRAHAQAAETLCRAVAGLGWGVDWMLPALPIATSDQLTAGLANSIATECTDVMADFEIQRTKAREAGRADLGARAAATVDEKLKTIAARATNYADLIGPRHVERIKTQLEAARNLVEPLLDPTVQRGALLEMHGARY